MKIKILFLLLIVNWSLFSVEYNRYDMAKVYEFEVGPGNEGAYNTLGIAPPGSQGPTPSGPYLSYYDNHLHIIDIHRDRTLKLEKNYSFSNEFKYAFYQSIVYKMDNTLIGFSETSSISVIRENGVNASISLYYIDSLKRSKSVYFQDNTLFIHDKDNTLWSITNPSTDWKENRKKLTNEEDTLELIYTGTFEGLTIDSAKRLFLNGKLQTLDYDTFLGYHREIQKKKGLVRPKVNFTMQVKDFKTGSETLIGTDDLGYTYWSSWNTDIAVFNPEGFLVELFVVDKEYIPTYPTVTSEGDIYFMHHDVDKVTLYRIKRQW